MHKGKRNRYIIAINFINTSMNSSFKLSKNRKHNNLEDLTMHFHVTVFRIVAHCVFLTCFAFLNAMKHGAMLVPLFNPSGRHAFSRA